MTCPYGKNIQEATTGEWIEEGNRELGISRFFFEILHAIPVIFRLKCGSKYVAQFPKLTKSYYCQFGTTVTGHIR